MKRYPFLLLGLAAGAAAAPAQAVNVNALVRDGAVAPVHAAAPAPQGRNLITGMIFDESRRPVSEVYVELLNELDVTINRARTSSNGRYEFPGLGEGRFKVKVLPLGTDYAQQVQEVHISNVSALGGGSGGEMKQVDFYLRLRPELLGGPFYAPGTLFAQEVPDAAKKLYEKGVGELRSKKEAEGFASLRQALELFPTYYLALDRLGTEYAVRGNQDKRYFEAARVLLIKAVEVNSKSFSSRFGLGFAQYHLGLNKESVENLQQAVSLNIKSPNAHLWLGIAQRRAGDSAQAEALRKRADSPSKSKEAETYWQQAEASLKRANDLSKGKEADVHWQLANLYNGQKRYAEAAAELELFLKHKPDARDAEKIRQMIGQLKQKATP